MRPEERWLGAMWPEVRSHLPPPPGVIVELGCGSLGGFVPKLRAEGYDAIGVDPAAPEGEHYQRIEFERSELPGRVNGVIACTSLHHVSEPGVVLDRIVDALAPAGTMVVVEWDWESFDEATAQWAFERLDEWGSEGWLQRRRDAWRASGASWEDHLHSWANGHGLHSARGLIRELDERFQRVTCVRAPFLFSKLDRTTQAEERTAIDAGEIRALRLDYVGQLG